MEIYDKWIKNRLSYKQIQSINEITLTGKNIILAPEGLGKSTGILDKLSKENKTSFYCTHTIENAEEKFKFSKARGYNCTLIDSDSELFRKMIRSQDNDLYMMLKKISAESNENYIFPYLYSYDIKNDTLSAMLDTPAQHKRIKAQIEFNKTASGVTSSLFGNMYNYLRDMKCKDKLYILLYTVSDNLDYFPSSMCKLNCFLL
jgi:hypothetical protein